MLTGNEHRGFDWERAGDIFLVKFKDGEKTHVCISLGGDEKGGHLLDLKILILDLLTWEISERNYHANKDGLQHDIESFEGIGRIERFYKMADFGKDQKKLVETVKAALFFPRHGCCRHCGEEQNKPTPFAVVHNA